MEPNDAPAAVPGHYRPAPALTLWLTILLAAGAGLDAFSALLSLVELVFFPGFGVTGAEPGSGEVVLALGYFAAGSASLLALIATAALFCFWAHRANANVRALGARGMAFTPGWTVGWFFIPVMNLYKPYRALAEVYLASDPGADAETWRTDRVPAMVQAWWGAWLINGFLGQASWRMSQQKDVYSSAASAWMGAASSLAGVGAGVLCLLLVRAIRSRQEAKALRLSEAGARATHGQAYLSPGL
ncbi:MAG: DUF4328 domain-containing protein [Elusimicrobia bacterium]|nr:DUF4328 domain-containing protein [Elusimicrobiota bacterium]